MSGRPDSGQTGNPPTTKVTQIEKSLSVLSAQLFELKQTRDELMGIAAQPTDPAVVASGSKSLSILLESLPATLDRMVDDVRDLNTNLRELL